jgi:general secretion pathway protein A
VIVKMFTQFFNLKFNPFTKEVPADKLFPSQNLTELTSRLMYLQKTRGIGLIIGEAGTGKSSALRKYAHSLNPALFESCYFPLSTVTVQEFYRGLALELGEEPKHKKIDLFHQIQSAIHSMYYERRVTPVIILDEIHMASTKLLEDLRLIFNFNMDSENPFILILAGQPPIRNKLTLSINHPLRQRIVVKHMMSNLHKEELAEYLKSRLIFAGTHEDLFTPPSIQAIYGVTSGVPRLVNSLATNSLLVACEKKQRQVDEETVYQAQSELNF